MGFLDSLKNFFASPAPSGSGNFITFKIMCDRCGEEINVKLRRTSDISRIYEDEENPCNASFFVRKEILGNKCNNLIFLTAYFGENFNLISSEITGGKFVD
jgi:hypothetical protein